MIVYTQLHEQRDALIRPQDGSLAAFEWIAIGRETIADVSAYSYIVSAPEGDVSLDAYRNVHAWLKRIEDLPGFVAMPAAPSRKAA